MAVHILFYNETNNPKNRDLIMQILHFEVCLPLQKFSAAATTRGNRVRSNHRSSCFQLEGTCAFRKLAPAKLDRLGRDLIFF